ncbi:TIGR00266 family protein [Thermaerobacter sp. PB12/4term]|uniref:TIGR00266 family protein n=1 Tax=Thermaerobacter sp. PB12/4term TaxID=2293838 RepID=UPI000E32C0BD|nr:TIGR00266 family protein [Thermaerobacter sp. PB12/4term]QIA26384.1 TIGR00266 family protein [Thermaerobacter sp. PB12/4term]
MQYRILHQPSYALAIVELEPGEELQAEPGALVSMSGNVSLQAEARGGLLGALSRSLLGGESFFTSRYRADGARGEVMLAPALPGDITVLELAGEVVYLKSGAFLAGATTLTVDARWGGARGFFGSGGLFLLRVAGHGPLFINSYGALHRKELAPGQRYVVDTGHVVAFTDGMAFQVRAAGSGWFSSIASGEGLACEFTGPGAVYIQTRSEASFLGWLIPKLPSRRE